MKWKENAAKLAAALCEELIEESIMPVIKDHVIVLDDELAKHKPSIHDILSIIKGSLTKAGISYDRILVKEAELIINDKEPSGKMMIKPKTIFMCPHCGFTTTSEEEYWIHLKCHYVGF
ncbi:MAG: hypothetical protein DRN49_01920 [Thaumarchaeota archaeon]|nr:MAG: hypothetical protein DRN49_01920 [Nitrososphaerota archaeon]